MSIPVHVAVGVVFNDEGLVLIARRPPHVHLGGLWEFPGGKREADESIDDALVRELVEEIGIWPRLYRPLIKLHHHYPERHVLLDVWRVDAFTGTPHGRENQPIAWVPAEHLAQYEFPAGNLPIITAARLPDRYAILDVQRNTSPEETRQRLERLAIQGVTLAQLRASALDEAAYARLAHWALMRAKDVGIQLLLNGAPEWARDLGAAGVHLSSRRLAALNERPLPTDLWVAASCHSAAELTRAAAVGCDFAVLGPVRPTASHPNTPALGWNRFADLTETAVLPVYALGGVGPADLATAHAHGGQGVAGIRAFLA